ncbi:DUF2062 domain-containing protein [Tropicimonas isoalkanivorans]|uniref:DUF2062 domain-containing protein n=1 Tax=Tropicimonas isoalkanivorans TaxID=441112 RepID=A0A1I1PBH1_9RHOB|nr:DUF2062 domain-containing protein [Tropicimonas isoalkanivorans]SFD07065.1 hypothetical protein SAMN04488094_114102 [Tropicimonas isoalkanivorans]
MVFKRREKRSWLRIAAESVWPRGGWGRAAIYVKHRIRRLPDKPHRIARGIFAGVFVSFTPFYGLHFVTAFLVAKVIGGNFLAALLATFFGNPITFPFIAAIALKLGYWILGLEPNAPIHDQMRKSIEDGAFHEHMNFSLMTKFSGAFADLWSNFRAIFTDDVANWHRLGIFYHEVFLPFLVGGIVPGLIAGLIAYYVTLPLITAYQNRRKIMFKKRLAELRAGTAKAAAKKAQEPGS